MSFFFGKRRALTPLFLLVLIALTRLFGLLRSSALAALWGVGENAAAFELTFSLSSTLYDLSFGAVLSAMFIPACTARWAKDSKKAAQRFTLSLLPALFAGTGLLYLPLFLFPQAVLTLFAGELSHTFLALAVPSLRLLSAAKILLGGASLFVGFWQVNNRPLLPALVYAASSLLSLIAVLLFGKKLDAVGLSGILLLLDLMVGLLLFLLTVPRKRSLLEPEPLLPYRPPRLGPFTKKIAQVMIFSAYLPAANLLTTVFSARIGGDASLAANGYAAKPVLLSAALLSSVLHATLYPRLARDGDGQSRFIKKILFSLLALTNAGAILLSLLARPLLSVLYLRGFFNEASLSLTTSFLRLYALSLPLLTLIPLLSDLAYLQKKTGSLAAVGSLALLLDLLLLAILPRYLADAAVPIAYFIASLFFVTTALILLFRTESHESKLRLVLVLSDDNIGGAGRQMLNYLEHCDRDRFEVTVLLPENAALTPDVSALGYSVIEKGTASSFSLPSVLLYFRLFCRLRPHIVNASASLSARIAAFLAHVPIRVYTRHCVYPAPSVFRHTLPRLVMGLTSSLLSTSAIAVAEKAAQNLYDMGIPPRKVTVIPNGVDPMPTNPAAGQQIRRSHGFENNLIAVICGRIEPDKGIRTLIEAAALLKTEKSPIRFLVVGKGSEEQELIALTQKRSLDDYVHFCSFTADVSPYLNAADIYLNCSVGTEATSLAIAEAMSLSLPIVATDYGGNPEMVQEGKNGILVPQRSPKALADALTILSDEALRRRFGEASLQIYTARYDACIMARRSEELYKKLYYQKKRKGYPSA